MYNYTRQEAADKLNISTRSIDRYIKAWKIRAKKIWKIVYVNESDINILSWETPNKQKIIIKQETEQTQQITNKTVNNEEKAVIKKNDYDKIAASFEKVFSWLRNEIQKKDDTIQNLSVKLWRMEEIVKNSVNLIDYKKSQFLLEESKNYLNKEVESLKEEKEKIDKELKYEKTTNKLLIFFLIILLIVAWLIWFYKI